MHAESLQQLALETDAFRRDGNFERVEEHERKMLEIVRSETPPIGRRIADHCVKVALTMNLRKRFAEAEPFAREGLALRKEHYPAESWQVASARSCLGITLMGTGALLESEGLLLNAFRQLAANASTIPTVYRIRIRETLQGLVSLYAHMGNKHAESTWRMRLAKFDGADV